jgi:DNA transformation protein and related proteins
MPKLKLPHPDQPFVDHCCDVLGSVGVCTAKRMFGGWGFYCDGLMIGLIYLDELYLKVDAQTKPAFVQQGSRVFRYVSPSRTVEMGYMTAPEEAMDSRPLMAAWARMAMEAALRSANAKPAAKKPAAKATSRKAGTAKTDTAQRGVDADSGLGSTSSTASSSKRKPASSGSSTQRSPASKRSKSPGSAT